MENDPAKSGLTDKGCATDMAAFPLGYYPNHPRLAGKHCVADMAASPPKFRQVVEDRLSTPHNFPMLVDELSFSQSSPGLAGKYCVADMVASPPEFPMLMNYVSSSHFSPGIITTYQHSFWNPAVKIWAPVE